MSEPVRLSAVVPDEARGLRLDRFLAETLALFPRSQIPHRAVVVRIDGTEARLSRRVQPGDRLDIEYREPEPSRVDAEPVPLSILFEDDDTVVIDKPAGMVVHPAAGNWSGTLAQGLMYHVESLAERFGEATRPGIVHRLDKETSGVIIAAKHPEALAHLAAQFKRRRAKKRYLAIVKGRPPKSRGTIASLITRDPANRKRFTMSERVGKEAVTDYRVLRHFGNYSFVSLRPKTGRTHQLRVHLAGIGCPILGDPLYARPDPRVPDTGLLLHAYQLTITLPSESSPRTFTAPLPERFRLALRAVSDRP